MLSQACRKTPSSRSSRSRDFSAGTQAVRLALKALARMARRLLSRRGDPAIQDNQQGPSSRGARTRAASEGRKLLKSADTAPQPTPTGFLTLFLGAAD